MDCQACKGTGRCEWYVGLDKKCYGCWGLGRWPEPDIESILNPLFTSSGFREGDMLPEQLMKGPSGLRRWYIWRFVRYWAGLDPSYPMKAPLMLGRDPYIRDLDAIAQTVALQVYDVVVEITQQARTARIL